VSTIQQNRYDQLLRRVANLKAQGSKVNDALTELFPVIDVENLPLDLYALMGTRIAAGISGEPNVVAFFQAAMLNNPVGSNMIIVLEQVSIRVNVEQFVVGGLTTNVYANTNVQQFQDGRFFPATVPTGRVLDDLILIPAPEFDRFRVVDTGFFEYAPAGGVAVLTPGMSYGVANTVLDTSLHTGWKWRERVAEPSELNF